MAASISTPAYPSADRIQTPSALDLTGVTTTDNRDFYSQKDFGTPPDANPPTNQISPELAALEPAEWTDVLLTPSQTPDLIRRARQSSTNQKSSLGPLSLPAPPVFSPPKSISVAGASGQLRGQLRSPDITIRAKSVQNLEHRIMTMQGQCPTDLVENLRVRTFQLDSKTMAEYMKSPGIYDHAFQNGMGCLVDALTSKDPHSILPDIRLRRWITSTNRIGGPSAEGMAFQLSNQDHPMFVIKVTNDPQQDHLAHEALVGMGAINQLRDQIPNFMHTYGAFMCAPPILDADGKVITWCPSKKSAITYLVLENIDNSQPLQDIAAELEPDEFLQIYLQILNALNLAAKKYDFTHYDLHAGNVLIQTLSYEIAIPFYHPGGGLRYLNTRRLARIIDFGMAHIYLEGQHFGAYGLNEYGVDPEQSFPIADAYKLLLMTAFAAIDWKDKTTKLADMTNKIYNFFGEGKTVEARLIERSANPLVDYFQASLAKSNKTLDQLILHILDVFTVGFLTLDQPAGSISAVCADNCIKWNDFNKYVFDQTRLPATLEQYCESMTAIQKLAQGAQRQHLSDWVNQFNLEQAYQEERVVFEADFNENIAHLNQIKVPMPQRDSEVGTYEKTVLEVLKLRNRFIGNEVWIASALCAYNMSGELGTLQDDMQMVLSRTVQIKAQLTELYAQLKFRAGQIKHRGWKLTPQVEAALALMVPLVE